MKRLWLGLLLFFSAFTLAQQQAANPEQEVLALHVKWLRASNEMDIDLLDELESDGFVLIRDGQIETKAERFVRFRPLLEDLESRRAEGERILVLSGPYTISHQRFSLLGDVAVLSGISSVRSFAFTPGSAFSEVWVRENGAWRLLSAHYSAVDRGPH